eukprot:CAMPEP_0119399574 /NCGR_PEP_ID=MMETSP1334-20130426/141428_1 /TAXON_ID=127549 /ORGANISM="Calcidiscus leptoporus, Strain RCC1130" /LENGTH=173 /DNA_ID=CAMNT_0007423467 /DNA_START=87 /DNA_END=608 /DNA_ORIENTATION=+
MSAVDVTNVSDDEATAETAELLKSFFEFHGAIRKVTVSGTAACIQFADATAARSALLFDKAAFLGRTIGVAQASVEAAAEKVAAEKAAAEKGADPKRAEEEFERVEHPLPSAAAIQLPELAATSPPAKAAGSGAAAASLGRFECFRQALSEPPNNASVSLLVTLAAMAMLSLS